MAWSWLLFVFSRCHCSLTPGAAQGQGGSEQCAVVMSALSGPLSCGLGSPSSGALLTGSFPSAPLQAQPTVTMGTLVNRRSVGRERALGTGWSVPPAAGLRGQMDASLPSGLQACQLALSARTVWARCPNGDLARRYGVSDKNPAGDYWKRIPGSALCLTGRCRPGPGPVRGAVTGAAPTVSLPKEPPGLHLREGPCTRLCRGLRAGPWAACFTPKETEAQSGVCRDPQLESAMSGRGPAPGSILPSPSRVTNECVLALVPAVTASDELWAVGPPGHLLQRLTRTFSHSHGAQSSQAAAPAPEDLEDEWEVI